MSIGKFLQLVIVVLQYVLEKPTHHLGGMADAL